MSDTARVTASEYARRSGKAIGTVQKAIATGRVARGADGLIAVADADRYWESCKGAQAPHPDIAAARLRRLQAQVALAELAAANMRARLVPMATVTAVWSSARRLVCERFLAIPAQVAPLLVGQTKDHEIRRIIDTAVRHALTDLPADLPP